jgi:hypothetical protein
MESQPLRAIILDNDETTGSYGILFTIQRILQNYVNIEDNILLTILERLASWMLTHHIFRPGFYNLLEIILKLKRAGHIDSVIMYTNQVEQSTIQRISNIMYSTPRCLEYMFQYIAGDVVIDHILARPENAKIEPEGHIRKSFQRVLDIFPERPRDIRQMIFIDDIAHPDCIDADGIDNSKKNIDCWYPVEPYKRIISPIELEHCIEYVFHNTIINENMYSIAWGYYQSYIPKYDSIRNAKILLELCEVLQRKYGRVFKKDGVFHQTKYIEV